jgi:DNA-3-methyladenine glycosylase I
MALSLIVEVEAESFVVSRRRVIPHTRRMPRCAWATKEPSITYHDEEWGVPVHDDRTLFEFLILEGAQAGLSWETILKKRDNYRRAFHGFDARKIASYTAADTERLLADSGHCAEPPEGRRDDQERAGVPRSATRFGSFDACLWNLSAASRSRTAGRAQRNCRLARQNPMR